MKNKLIFITAVLSLLFLGMMVGSHSIYHYKHSIADQKEKAWIIARTISKSIDLPMLEGEMDTVQDMLITVGELEDVTRLHITGPDGTIYYSSDPERIGTLTGSELIEKSWQEKKDIDGFEHREGDFIFTLASPIYNEKRCYPCHGKKEEILGILRVGIDWAPIKAQLTKVFQRELITAGIFYAFILILTVLFQRLYNNAQQSYIDLKQTQERLIKTEKMAVIGQMAAAMSHDLRNPLTGIKMATYYLGTKIDRKKKEIDRILKDIELEIDYASNVVTNILTYAKPTELIYTRANINKVIEDALHFIYLQDKDSAIKLNKDFDPRIPNILVDAKQIKQVFVNLLSNSIQAMPQGGVLDVRTKRQDDCVQIEIKDTGTGISQGEMDKIFTPFFTTKARGVGLGLSIVNNIITKHKGTIEIHSEPGQQTTFLINLPLKKPISG